MRTSLALFALLCAPGVVAAQVTGNVALLSDYRFRGESLTEGKPALQAAVNYDHSSGLFAGGLVSNVRIDPDVIGLSAQVYGGYTRPIGERASWDVGVVTYVFPPPSGGPTYNYTEVFVGASFDTVTSRLYYTNSYFGGSGFEVKSRTYRPHIRFGTWLSRLEGPEPPGRQQLDCRLPCGPKVDVSPLVALSIVGTNAQGALARGSQRAPRRQSCPCPTPLISRPGQRQQRTFLKRRSRSRSSPFPPV